jgi:polyisoprenoid-binding protein YceI
VGGGILFDGEDLSAASVEATIGVSSVDSGNETRDEHIQEREDFFEAGTFPEMTFESTRVEPGSDGRLSIFGDLTIRDVTNAVVLDARYGGTTTDGAGTRRATFDAETHVSRKDFGLDWGGKAGRAVVGDTVSVKIHLEAVEQPSL